MPTLVGPDVIEKELAAWDEFRAAFLRGDRERPSLPTPEGDPPLHVALAAAAVRTCLIFLAALGRLLGLRSVQLWAAGRVLNLDRLSLEPASCGLNRAYARLGLAKLAAGDQLGAIACLRNSWHVHPCPHSTSFGLSPTLWRALARTPAAADARREYEEMARRFCGRPEWPSRHSTWKTSWAL